MPIHWLIFGKKTSYASKATRHHIDGYSKLSKHFIIANAGYTHETGEGELKKGITKMISYGVPLIANPDLTRRYKLNAPLSQSEGATFCDR